LGTPFNKAFEQLLIQKKKEEEWIKEERNFATAVLCREKHAGAALGCT